MEKKERGVSCLELSKTSLVWLAVLMLVGLFTALTVLMVNIEKDNEFIIQSLLPLSKKASENQRLREIKNVQPESDDFRSENFDKPVTASNEYVTEGDDIQEPDVDKSAEKTRDEVKSPDGEAEKLREVVETLTEEAEKIRDDVEKPILEAQEVRDEAEMSTVDAEKIADQFEKPKDEAGKSGDDAGNSQDVKFARSCSKPENIPNGWPQEGYNWKYQSRVTYHCNDGYEHVNQHSLECQANGEWSGEMPRCRAIHCQTQIPPVHGTMIGSNTEFNSIIRYKCSNGYKVVGSKERICQSDGKWSGQEPQCEEINCGEPGPLYNGYLDGHRRTVGGAYFFRCNPRTKFYGEHFSTNCMENGQWSNPLPQCLGQCQVPRIVNGTTTNHRLVPSTWLNHNETVKFTCLNGLVLNDSRPVRCDNGTWSMIPKCVPGCAQGFTRIAGVCYSVSKDIQPWNEAKRSCMAKGGFLAEPKSLQENKNIVDLMKSNGKLGAWIGATDKVREGHWVWANSSTNVTFTNRAYGEPDFEGEDCACLLYLYRWISQHCEWGNYFVCQM